MGLHIKNGETCALIRELLRLTGETMTHAVSVAVRERLEPEQAGRGRASAAEMLEIGKRIRNRDIRSTMTGSSVSKRGCSDDRGCLRGPGEFGARGGCGELRPGDRVTGTELNEVTAHLAEAARLA